jgi:hypothetical protein
MRFIVIRFGFYMRSGNKLSSLLCMNVQKPLDLSGNWKFQLDSVKCWNPGRVV